MLHITREEKEGNLSSVPSAASAPFHSKGLASDDKADDKRPADDKADDSGFCTVSHNPLRNNGSDDTDDADDKIPPLSLCAQCGKAGDLQQTYYGTEEALLHPNCQDAWLAARDDLTIPACLDRRDEVTP